MADVWVSWMITFWSFPPDRTLLLSSVRATVKMLLACSASITLGAD